MAAIPGIKTPKFFEKKWVVELVSVVPPLVAAGVTAYISTIDPTKRPLGLVLFGAMVWLSVSSALKVANAYAEDRQKQRQLDFDGLKGALLTLYAVVKGAFGEVEPPDHWLRVTFHRVVAPEKPDQPVEDLEQLVDYIGSSSKGAGRKFSIRSGIIGRAVREKTPFAASRQSDDYEEYIQELVRDWAYTEEDARKLRSDRKSWMAVPIFGPQHRVLGVVYLDSVEKGFFNKKVQQLTLSGCAGIASYINERYK